MRVEAPSRQVRPTYALRREDVIIVRILHVACGALAMITQHIQPDAVLVVCKTYDAWWGYVGHVSGGVQRKNTLRPLLRKHVDTREQTAPNDIPAMASVALGRKGGVT